jgi:Leucine-rich repeat (LRR) protein
VNIMASVFLFSECPLNPLRITRQRAEAGLAFEKHRFQVRGGPGERPVMLFEYRADQGPAVRESLAGWSIIDSLDLASLPQPPLCFTMLHDERMAPAGPAGPPPPPAVRGMIESAQELYLAFSAHALVDGTVADSLRIIEEILGAPMAPRRPRGVVRLVDHAARLRAVQTLGWRGLSNLYLLADPDPAWLVAHGTGGPQSELLGQLTRGMTLVPYEDFHGLVRACTWVLTTHARLPGQAPLCWYSTRAGSDGAAVLVEAENVADLPGYDQASAGEPRSADLHDDASLRAAESVSLARTDVVRLDELAAHPNIRALDLDGTPDLDLRGLARLPWLESLSLRGHKLVDVTFLRHLPALRHLALDRMPFQGFAGLQDAVALRSLSLLGMRISDARFLRNVPRLESLEVDHAEPAEAVLAQVSASCPHLTHLVFHARGLTSIAALAGMSLHSLSLYSTPITDLAPLAGMTSLRELSLQQTAAVDVTPLAGLQQLETLSLLGTPVPDLAPLGALAQLRTLDLQYVPATDLGPLAALRALEDLTLADTAVSDLSPLAGLQHLRELRLDNTRVTRLEPVIELPALTRLDLRGTPVTDYTPLLRAPRLATLLVRDGQVPEPVRSELASRVELIVS